MRKLTLVMIATTAVCPGLAASQEVHRYHERIDGLVTITTPGGPIEMRSEHDASISVQSMGVDSLHAWYDALSIAAIGPQMEDRPDATSVLGQRFVLRTRDDGRVETLQFPDFPASFENVTDLTAQFFDFFPSRPDGGFAVGTEWTDTVVAPPLLAPDTDSDMRKTIAYRVVQESESDGVAVFVIRADSRLDYVIEAPVPNQPTLRVKTTMTGSETNTFLVAKADGHLIERHRTAELSGQMEYIGTPQPMILPLTREYESTIGLIGR